MDQKQPPGGVIRIPDGKGEGRDAAGNYEPHMCFQGVYRLVSRKIPQPTF